MTKALPMPEAGSVAPQTKGFEGQQAAPVFVSPSMGAASENLASGYGNGFSPNKDVSCKHSDKTEHSDLYAFNGNVADFKTWKTRWGPHGQTYAEVPRTPGDDRSYPTAYPRVRSHADRT